jgi:hypothetical protein
MAETWGGFGSGPSSGSPVRWVDSPGQHAACDTAITGLRARAEAAEAKLTEIRDLVEAGWPGLRPSTRLGSGTAVQRILAITGTGGMASAEECPVVFTPRDSEFCAQCTCDQAARHGGHHHCPHCGVWYTLASDVKRATATEGGGDHG